MPHGPRIPEEALREMARLRIADGRLPVMFPHSMHAGYGTGAICRVCEQPVEPHHVEYEVTNPQGSVHLFFHLACYAIWQLECRSSSLQRERVESVAERPRR